MYYLRIGSKDFQIRHDALSSLVNGISDDPDNIELIKE